MDLLQEIFGAPKPTTPTSLELWEAAHRTNEPWDARIEELVDPEDYQLVNVGLSVPSTDGQHFAACSVRLHICGKARIDRELAEHGFQSGSEGVLGSVLRGKHTVDMWVIGGWLPNGRFAVSQWGLGHELLHLLVQLVIYILSMAQGDSDQVALAKADAHNADPDHLGEGL